MSDSLSPALAARAPSGVGKRAARLSFASRTIGGHSRPTIMESKTTAPRTPPRASALLAFCACFAAQTVDDLRCWWALLPPVVTKGDLAVVVEPRMSMEMCCLARAACFAAHDGCTAAALTAADAVAAALPGLLGCGGSTKPLRRALRRSAAARRRAACARRRPPRPPRLSPPARASARASRAAPGARAGLGGSCAARRRPPASRRRRRTRRRASAAGASTPSPESDSTKIARRTSCRAAGNSAARRRRGLLLLRRRRGLAARLGEALAPPLGHLVVERVEQRNDAAMSE